MITTIENKPRALIFVLVCIVFWSFAGVASKLGQQHLDNYQFLFWSSLLSFVVLLISTIIVGKFKYFKSYTLKQFFIAIGLGFLGTFLYYLLLYFGYAHAKGLEVLVIQYTWPIFIVIFSVLFLREKITWKTILAIILGFFGVLIVLTKGNFASINLTSFSTDFVVLFSAIIFGIFLVLSKKVEFEPFSVTTLFFLSATIFSFFSMLIFSSFATPVKSELIPILGNGIFINGLSYVLWLKSLSYAKASFIAPFVFLAPVLAAILIVLFFHEIFLPVYIVGLFLVICAGIIQNS